MRLALFVCVLTLAACGGPQRAPDFEQRAAKIERVALVHTKGRLDAAWAADLLPALAKVSSVALEAGGAALEPVERGKELGAQAVLALEVERRSRSTRRMDKLSASHAGERSYLAASARLYEVSSGDLLWECRCEQEVDDVTAVVVARCSEEVVGAWPLVK